MSQYPEAKICSPKFISKSLQLTHVKEAAHHWGHLRSE
jgi:hypothetical protein